MAYSDDEPVAGTAEGDGDFETDALPSTGETSGGGQLPPAEETRDGIQGGPRKPEGLIEHIIDEISAGIIQT